MDYNDLEAELVDILNSYFKATLYKGSQNLDTVFLARLMPENDDEFSTPGEKSLVNVHYTDSNYDQPKVTHIVSQVETIKVAVYLQSRKLRSDAGAYALLKHIKKCLVGYKPKDARTKMYITSYGDWRLEKDESMLMPFVEFSFQTFSNEASDGSPALIGGPATQITVEE